MQLTKNWIPPEIVLLFISWMFPQTRESPVPQINLVINLSAILYVGQVGQTGLVVTY